ncbi:ComEA family DNA-binding protein [Falsarthrobacter nasiphocae]|uniref:Competence protein ComEA n=1 Tax=Falsarthrobacter nasiphocae TaxID=189863 RepID=A0AAE3YFY9_9MICC|nr:ComEA family DNA-binding protein [Falsarthrobacter nasiphocae]MDR6891061.1 competence protein ComEA [Falsarthrobacter nasiphocae]
MFTRRLAERWPVSVRRAVAVVAALLALAGLLLWKYSPAAGTSTLRGDESAQSVATGGGQSGHPVAVPTPTPARGRGPAGTRPPSPGGAASEVTVDITGAVKKPGVYTLPAPARVAQAIDRAGGLAANADEDRINRAALLADGAKITVPRVGEPAGPPQLPGPAAPAPGGGEASRGGSDAGKTSAGAPVRINGASVAEIQTLPRIGPVLARRIVDDREARGPFASLEDLGRVKGLGPSIREGIAGRVVFDR